MRQDISTLYKPLHKFDFEWTLLKRNSTPKPSRQEQFSRPSPVHDFGEDIYGAFVSIWDSNIMVYIAEQTNKYAKRIRECETTGWNLDWLDTNADELYVYFAMLLTIDDTESFQKFWSRDGSEFKSNYFSCAVTLKRFKLLSHCLFFGDMDTISNNNEITPTQQKWLVIKPIINHLNDRFSQLFNLTRDVVINENAHENGHESYSSITKNKIKMYQMSDYYNDLCYASYVWRLEIEIDNILQESSISSEVPLSDNISSAVLKLVHGLEKKGHTIWLQDFFNSPALARELKSLGFDCVGSFNTDKKFVPSECKTLLSNMTPGQLKRFTSNDIDLYTYSSMRNEGIKHFLSTFHNHLEVKTFDKNDIMEPSVVVDCQRCQDGIYEQSQLLDYAVYESTEWYHVLFMRLLNISALNATILSSNSSNFTFSLYGKLAYRLMEHHGHVLSTPPVLYKESLE